MQGEPRIRTQMHFLSETKSRLNQKTLISHIEKDELSNLLSVKDLV